MDARWGLVLDCLGAGEPPFSQGGLQGFRERMIAHDMDRRLLERTVEVARTTEEFDWKKLPKELRVAIDSRPFEGAGRVEDTFNLLGHAIRKLVQLSAELLERTAKDIYREIRVPELMTTSVKAVLDVDWSKPDQKAEALQTLLKYVGRVEKWLAQEDLLEEEPLAPYVASLKRVKEQNLEPAATGAMQIRDGVAPDRQISIEDPEMRAGRKSKSQLFNGYKQHVAVDLDTQLVVGCAVTPGNVYDADATPALAEDMARLEITIAELYVDRGYVSSLLVAETFAAGGEVLAKPWAVRNVKHPELFSKSDFKIDLRRSTITCPAGEVERAVPGATVTFKSEVCSMCPLRSQCAWHGPKRYDRSRRSRAEEVPATATDRARSSATPRTCRRRAQARAHRTAAGTSSQISGRPQEPLRPPTHLRTRKPRTHPSSGCRMK